MRGRTTIPLLLCFLKFQCTQSIPPITAEGPDAPLPTGANIISTIVKDQSDRQVEATFTYKPDDQLEFEQSVREMALKGCLYPLSDDPQCPDRRRRLLEQEQNIASTKDGSAGQDDDEDDSWIAPPTYDINDKCAPHPQNYHQCTENIQCLGDLSNQDWLKQHCAQNSTFVPCNACTGSNQICHESRTCGDVMFRCNYLTEDEKKKLPTDHPCVVEECSLKRTTSDCQESVFSFCCDPKLESCSRKTRSSCTAAGCSDFLSQGHVEIDYKIAKCPFKNATATCMLPECNQEWLKREIIDLFSGTGNGGCQGEHCFENYVRLGCPATNSTNSSRRLFTTSDSNTFSAFTSRVELEIFSGRRLHISSSADSAGGAPKCVTEGCPKEYKACSDKSSCKSFMENDCFEKESDSCKKWKEEAGDTLKNLTTCASSACQSGDPMECVSKECSSELKTCSDDTDCKAYMDKSCPDNRDSKECTDLYKKVQSKFDPVMKCYVAKCDRDGKCINEKCKDSYDKCTQDTNCKNFLDKECHDKNSTECADYRKKAESLLAPFEKCFVENCDPKMQCVMQNCKEKYDSCFKDDNCKSYFENDCDNNDSSKCGDWKKNGEKLIKEFQTCYGQHCSETMQCILGECKDSYDACQKESGCKNYLDKNCHDNETQECKDWRASSEKVLKGIEECYSSKCMSKESNGTTGHQSSGGEGFPEHVKKCLQDKCSAKWKACEEKSSCNKFIQEFCHGDSEKQGCKDLRQDAEQELKELEGCYQEQCDEGPSGDHSNDPRASCGKKLGLYCHMNPTDPACQMSCPYQCSSGKNCPCATTACTRVYEAPRCIRDNGVCREFKEDLVQEYLRQGHYQPTEEWNRKQKLMFLLNKPKGPFNMTAALKAKQAKCNAVYANLGDNIAACVDPAVKFCNVREWDNGCRSDLSTCGDSYVSWGEMCDDGNKKMGDGCPMWCHPEQGYICPKQGKPCEKCIRDRRAQWGFDDQKVCTFCLNDRVNQTSPCFFPACRAVKGYDEAKACDEYVSGYCKATQDAGLSDLGCMTYVNKTRMHTVPSIPNKCEYKIKTITLNAQSISKVKLAVFVCKFRDQYGQTKDTTPRFRYSHPYHHMSDSKKKKLNSNVTAILDAMLKTRKDELIPLSDLRISDFFEYTYPELNDNGNPFWMHNRIADLEINFEDKEYPAVDRWGNPNCRHEGRTHRIIPLPPTKEPMKWALKAFLMHARWEAVNYGHGDTADFKSFDPESIDTGKENLNSTLVFGTILSRTYKDHEGKDREEQEHICKDWNIRWHERKTHPNCTTLEKNIRSGLARLRFDRNLYQAGCKDDQCDLKVDHCRRVKLAPSNLVVSQTSFEKTSKHVMDSVSKMDKSKSWTHLVEKFIAVSAAASTRAFDDAMDLFDRLVIKGKQPKFMKNVPDYCPHHYHLNNGSRNPEWIADPCCNWELREYMCCAPKDVPNGEIEVVKSINLAHISTYCQNNTAAVADLLQDMLINLNLASKCSQALDGKVSSSAWDEMWKVEETCRTKIYDAKKTECEKDSDCSHCSQSQCQITSGTKGKCTVPWDNTEGCMLECFSSEMDPQLIRYLREDWNLSANANKTVFQTTFTKHMTEPACTGPRAWESDIGFNGYRWKCNTTCIKNHICDDHDYKQYLREKKREQSDGWSWINFQDKATCEQYNGTLECEHEDSKGVCQYRQCQFKHIQGSCKKEQACYKKCGKVYQKKGCLEEGGKWIQTSQHSGQCCPPGAHVYKDRSGRQKCSLVPEGSPPSHQIRNLACCEANNGSWAIINDRGQCCLGQWKTVKHNKNEHTYCQDDIWGWDRQSCYEECDGMRKECTQCRVDREGCCGNVYQTANKTACLSYKECTNSHLEESECKDSTPFCARCWGKHCYKTSQQPLCYYSHIWSQSSCTAKGGTWDSDRWRCKVAGKDGASAWDCFSPGASVCPNPTNYTLHYRNREVPKYPWRSQSCSRGCYLTNVTKTNCTNWPRRWNDRYANGTGVCEVSYWHANTKAKCDGYGGTFVPDSIAYDPGRFSTQEQCDQGQCRGSLGWDGWSRAQCEASTKYTCTESCQECRTYTYPYRDQNHGACFSSNATTCTNAGKSTTPCIITTETEDTCTSSNTLGVVWKSCRDYANSTSCSNKNDTYAETLGCRWNWAQCTTKETCEAQGQCNDWDNQRQVCGDSGWKHGDQCWAHYSVEKFDTKTNKTITEWKSDSCNTCQWLPGVCVEPRSKRGCDNGKWHRLGCKVYGVYNKTGCEAVTDRKWYVRATSKDECHQVKGCEEPGRWGLSGLNPTECTKCGGKQSPVYTWRGGVWMKPRVENMTWHAEGAKMVSVNEWKPAIADWRLKDQLTGPIVKRFATTKKTQALLMYNIFSEALGTLSCACGGNDDNRECFNSKNGSVSGVSKAFCGLAAPIDAACGNTVVNKTCSSASNGRRLAAAKESVALTWTHHTAGVYGGCLAPYTSKTQRALVNPLAVTNANGVVYGQLLGDGKGLKSDATFESAEICLKIRHDIRNWNFGAVDVAKRTTGDVFTPLFITKWKLKTTDQLCFTATADGDYFPIDRVDKTLTQINALTTNLGCVKNKGIALYNASTDSYACQCRCGYSGSTCADGCLNFCNNNGTCNAGVCSCNKGRTGPDCGEFACPIGSNTRKCSGNGVCQEDASCKCLDNFKGSDCSTQVFVKKNVTGVSGFGDIQYPQQQTTAPNPSPTPAPSPTKVEPTPSPPTTPPRPIPTPPPTPPPTQCMQDNCKASFESCVSTFDRCACYPGLIKCAEKLCADTPEEVDTVTKTCDAFVSAYKDSCGSECKAAPYPTAKNAKLEMSVAVKVELAGVTKAQFEGSFQNSFKDAVAETVPSATRDDVTINGVREVNVRRILTGPYRRLATTKLEVDFSIKVKDAQQLKAVKQVLNEEMAATSGGDGGGGSKFAKALESKGVITDASQLSVKEAKTKVVVVSADDDEEYAVKQAEQEKKKDGGVPVAAVAGAAAGAVVAFAIFCCCCRKKKSVS